MSQEVASIPTPPRCWAPAPGKREVAPSWRDRMSDVAQRLRQAFDVEFMVLDVGDDSLEPCEVVGGSSDNLLTDSGCFAELCRAVCRGGQPEIIADEDPLLLLALPVPNPEQRSLVALAPFVTRAADAESLRRAAGELGFSPTAIERWTAASEVTTAGSLVRMAKLAMENLRSAQRIEGLRAEVEQISTNLLGTYEEISLIYRLTQNLKLSKGDAALAELALEWLSEVIPAKGLLVKFTGEAAPDDETNTRDQGFLVTYGDCPVAEEQFDEFIAALGREAISEPIVLNRRVTWKPSWPFPAIHEVISVPLTDNGKTFGWLMAINHEHASPVGDDEGGERLYNPQWKIEEPASSEYIIGEFGTVEASLLGSVGAILAIHASNTLLYREQADFLAGVVRALTSAIDAKDPYTCGHSDRVARVSVRLAQELGCDVVTQNTIYMSGLLHDIGKIGIDDQVLRKPGKLTEAEYEHIKLHPELGYKILRDLKQIDEVLPVVLHHHEAWDGSGYPHGLAGDSIPFLARIVAVADSFDAMSSDRPYRPGMVYEKVESILHNGAGSQWDAQVVEAFLRARDDIRGIANSRSEVLRLDVRQWQ